MGYYPTGRVLWEGDVDVTNVSEAWERLFGEPFDKAKAVKTWDTDDATGYLMPGGYVVYDDTYPTNHGIYAPPRKAPEGAVWGLRIEPRADPIVMPILLPPGYGLTDNARKVYQLPGQGEEHTAKSRKFVFSAWRGTVYVLSGSERDAERERFYYCRTPEEAALDALKNWCDAKSGARKDAQPDAALVDATLRWYVQEGTACRECGARGRVHPTTLRTPIVINGRTFDVGDVPAMECGACGECDAWLNDLRTLECAAAARSLRYYGPEAPALKFGRKALGIHIQRVGDRSGFTPDQVLAWERGDAEPPENYTNWLIEKLETTW